MNNEKHSTGNLQKNLCAYNFIVSQLSYFILAYYTFLTVRFARFQCFAFRGRLHVRFCIRIAVRLSVRFLAQGGNFHPIFPEMC
jgi:hypothetical protein